ncbi:MAG: penicillin acylase family protein, partial [Ignavibacteriaceae bacterium]
QWGRMHKEIFKHPFSGYSSLIDKFIDIGPFAIGGDGTTIFNTEYPFYNSINSIPQFRHKEFENTVGPAMRYIFDFAEPNTVYMILNTGESGNVFSRHYKDMAKMWLTGKYIKIKTDESSIVKNKDLLEIDSK